MKHCKALIHLLSPFAPHPEVFTEGQSKRFCGVSPYARLAVICLLATSLSTTYAEDPPQEKVPPVPLDMILLPPVGSADEAGQQDRPVTNPAEKSDAASVDQLHDRKQESMERLGELAERLVQARNARKAKEALAELKAQRLREQRAAVTTDDAHNAAQTNEQQEEKEKYNTLRQRTESEITPSNTLPATNSAPSAHPRDPVTSEPVAPGPGTPETIPFPQIPEEPPGNPDTDSAVAPQDVTDTALHSTDGATIEGPIDRLGLATSLYATGRFQECRQILEAVDRTTLRIESQDWCDFLAASCCRKLGDLPEAERRYRALLGHTRVTWLAEATRWWLDHLNEQQKLRGDLVQLNANLKTWRTDIDALRDGN